MFATVGATLLAFGTVCASGEKALALATDCSADPALSLVDRVDGDGVTLQTLDCEFFTLSGSSDNAAELAVGDPFPNLLMTPWAELGRVDVDQTSLQYGSTEDNNPGDGLTFANEITFEAGYSGASGAFNVSEAVYGAYDEILFLMKDGSQNHVVYTYMLVDIPLISERYFYESPFAASDGSADISHVTFYGRSLSAEVPIPAAAPLLLGGLAGLGALRRRRRA